MMKAIALVAGFVYRHSPVFYERKRARLSYRLRWIFDRDFIEGMSDSLTRKYLAKN